jgi:hypothetical protein
LRRYSPTLPPVEVTWLLYLHITTAYAYAYPDPG